ncbi:SDR family NAD(P)-dependent oxidoreductase [Novosphingobium album (ex Liu et al. 2023)]|uniref:SDR family NAD(P)-dependent oxidoreductase n=1 Tax=Novosphingobium album (ex Liu et al. 2023) TaxID=3031130 RepID=A0ABT5WMC5_9SPHN|nr:SDR family NAD(P)-dependent oxidoreductase [Novosphingobium album (ex Liu et al. 2023)]MDE8650442.1 SDR family NAD(P)-dependent oxidoreductase [Novosphingobium album (ex Liu et al. 2023)]
MSERTWLVTGASRGFGRVLAEALLERGERVVATARAVALLEGLAAPYGDRALALALDVTRPEAIAAAVARALERFGAIDVLVNNAGHGHMGTVEDAPVADARAMMETNYFGALGMIKAVLPGMLARRSGQIVNIGSVAGQVGFPVIGYYCASKFALAGLTESMAAELAPLGIRVTLAELGPFATGFAGAMDIVPPAAHYDLAALSREAGNAGWGAGDDPRAGAEALLAALADPAPPRRLILGQPGLDVVALHEARRLAERERWLAVARLEAIVAG